MTGFPELDGRHLLLDNFVGRQYWFEHEASPRLKVSRQKSAYILRGRVVLSTELQSLTQSRTSFPGTPSRERNSPLRLTEVRPCPCLTPSAAGTPALPSTPPLAAGQLHCFLPCARDRREMRLWQERKRQPLQDTVLHAFPRRSGSSADSSKEPSLVHRTCPE